MIKFKKVLFGVVFDINEKIIGKYFFVIFFVKMCCGFVDLVYWDKIKLKGLY